jgi:hypothetical protein
MVIATKLAMFTVGLVLALGAGWGLGHVLGPVLTLTPPGAPGLQHPHTAPTFVAEETS